MSDTPGRTLLRRVAAEHRRTVVMLVAALAINALAYALIVRPLANRVANVAQREQAATAALTAARAEHATASGTLTGKDRAATELTTFYEKVLPADVSAARRLTHVRLQQLARQAGLRFERVANETMEERNSRLTRLRIDMALTGSWPSVRTFIHELEIAPEFVVIDNVELAESAEREGDLTVSLTFSTYFRTPSAAVATQ